MSTQLSELRLQLERLDYDNKEGAITIDTLKEQNQDLTNDLEEVRKSLAELKSTQRDATAEDKEKKKAEKMALMMAKFDTVGDLHYCYRNHSNKVVFYSKEHFPRRKSRCAPLWLN